VKRRDFCKVLAGSGVLAGLPGSLCAEPGVGAIDPLHTIPRARRVIYLYMAGGPSQFESFDYKPELAKRHGQPFPESLTRGQQLAQLQGRPLNCFAPQFGFRKWGESGQEISELFPNVGSVADELCIVRSGKTEQINHDPAHTFMNTGAFVKGRPSFGSWVNYALGSDNADLPGFVVLQSNTPYGSAQPIAAHQWSAGFLPARYQGVVFESTGDPVFYLSQPHNVIAAEQEQTLALARSLNAQQDAETAERYELAQRMRKGVAELVKVEDEPGYIQDLYGARPGDGSFASNCLMGRRLLEQGVRFVQLYHRGWDHHTGIYHGMRNSSRDVDQATAALIVDLKQRGMLEDTLVIWGGEFGRTPMAQADGRDHHIQSYSFFMAGGGVRSGTTYGRTDELGYAVVEDPVHVHDFHATALHLLGIEHTRATWRHLGRDFRLTDVHGQVLEGLIA
jgi:hypothetical protein